MLITIFDTTRECNELGQFKITHSSIDKTNLKLHLYNDVEIIKSIASILIENQVSFTYELNSIKIDLRSTDKIWIRFDDK